jgi:inner membrane protein
VVALYGMIYVLLSLEQTALLIGSLALFGALTAVMVLTRKVNWYELGKG